MPISILNIKEVKSGGYDDVWAIVRFYKGRSDWIKQVVELAPSHLLWAKYQKLKLNGEWDKDTFTNIYLPMFLKEMQQDKSRQKLNELFLADKAGKNIALVCFCTDESLCHRSIIAGLLQGVGCDVCVQSGKDYSKYFDMYRRQ